MKNERKLEHIRNNERDATFTVPLDVKLPKPATLRHKHTTANLCLSTSKSNP